MKETAYSEALSGLAARYDHREDTDYYTQPGNLFRLLTPDHQARLIHNIVQDMKLVNRDIQLRQIRHFYLADPAYGEGVAQGLGIDINEAIEEGTKQLSAARSS